MLSQILYIHLLQHHFTMDQRGKYLFDKLLSYRERLTVIFVFEFPLLIMSIYQ